MNFVIKILLPFEYFTSICKNKEQNAFHILTSIPECNLTASKTRLDEEEVYFLLCVCFLAFFVIP